MFEVTIKPDFEESPCNGCTSACCRAGVALQLHRREAKQMIEAGGSLRKLSRAERPPNAIPLGGAVYIFEEDCANLDPTSGECQIYESRPYACRAFPAGEAACDVMRKHFQQTVELGMPAMPPLSESA